MDNYLADDYLDESHLDKKATREAFGEAMVRVAEANSDVVVVNADLPTSLKLGEFSEKFPDRFIQVGVAEQIMAGVGTGLALYGKVPFITSFAAFSPTLNWSHIRLAAMSHANLKVASSHYGLNVGEDGASAQMLEDVALMRVLPEFSVVTPADYNQTLQAVAAVAKHEGPVYLRLTRPKTPVFMMPDAGFKIGKAQTLVDGDSATVVVTGSLVYETLKAAEKLSVEGNHVEVINLHTIKPLDHEAIAASVQKTGKLVTIEEHQIAGGMGSAVLESLAQYHPQLKFTPLLIGVDDKFGVSGPGEAVVAMHGLDRDGLYNSISKNLIS